MFRVLLVYEPTVGDLRGWVMRRSAAAFKTNEEAADYAQKVKGWAEAGKGRTGPEFAYNKEVLVGVLPILSEE